MKPLKKLPEKTDLIAWKISGKFIPDNDTLIAFLEILGDSHNAIIDRVNELSLPMVTKVYKDDIAYSLHTHGKNGTKYNVVEKRIPAIDTEGHMLASDTVQFLQKICIDDGVIYAEIEITREVK